MNLTMEMEDRLDDALCEIDDGSLSDETRSAIEQLLIDEQGLAVDAVEDIEGVLRAELETDGETTLYEAYKALLRHVEEVERERMSIEVARSVLNEEALEVLEHLLGLYAQCNGPRTVGNERIYAQTDGLIREEDTYEFYAVLSDPEAGTKEEWRETADVEAIRDVLNRTEDRAHDYFESFDSNPRTVLNAIETLIREDGFLEVSDFGKDEQYVQLDAGEALTVELPDLNVEVTVNNQGTFVDRVGEGREELQSVRWDDLPQDGDNS